MKIVSVNGSDGVGKTQQISLLTNGAQEMNFTGRLIDYSSRWPKLTPVEEFTWWFKDVPFTELVSIIIETIKARDLACRQDRLNVHDRGMRMFKAVCAATLLVREQTSVEKTMGVVDGLFEVAFPNRQIEEEVLLRASPEYRAKIKPILQIVNAQSTNYLPWQNEMYAEYQTWLAHFIDHYFLNSGSAKVVQVDGCILDVQNRIRKVINDACNTNLLPICDTLERLVAFGGLSESGKSSYAERLSTHHRYFRLKIKYFDGVIRDRGLPSNPGTLGQELLNFFGSHRHITHASIESLHSPDLPAYLKLLFGSRMKTVYLDTPIAARIERTSRELGLSREETKKKIGVKDAVKISRGADKVRDIADIVFGNNEDDFEKQFHDFFQML